MVRYEEEGVDWAIETLVESKSSIVPCSWRGSMGLKQGNAGPGHSRRFDRELELEDGLPSTERRFSGRLSSRATQTIPPSGGRMSQAPARSKDTGGGLFLSGEHYYRQIDNLCMNICIAKKIDDVKWQAFLEESLRLTNRSLVKAK